MKIEIDKLFEEYTPDFEENNDKEQSKRIKAIVKKKMAKSETITVKKLAKCISIGLVAASFMGMTVVAMSGNMEEFINVLSEVIINDSYSELPFTGKDNNNSSSEVIEMQNDTDTIYEFFSVPDVAFTQNGDIIGEFVGMYNGSNCLMLAMKITVPNEIDIDDAKMPFRFKVIRQDGSERILSSSMEPLTESDVENSYYVTYYLTDNQIMGSKLVISANGIYTTEQISEAENAVREKQNELYESFVDEYGINTDLWKKHWKDNDYDSISYNTYSSYLNSCKPIVSGQISAEINIPENNPEPITGDFEYGSFTLDPLSLHIQYASDCDLSDSIYRAYAIYMKDGTVISNDFFMFDDYSENNEKYKSYAYLHGTDEGRIMCFQELLDIENVEKIVFYSQTVDGNNIITSESLLYQN